MPQKAVPMIHVPDVRKTMEWYASIGFKVVRYNEEDDEVNWALLTFGDTEVMFDSGGKPSDAFRREVDLYVSVDDLDALRRRLDGRVEIFEDLHDTFYGMREFIIRDVNRFWITFGQPMQEYQWIDRRGSCRGKPHVSNTARHGAPSSLLVAET